MKAHARLMVFLAVLGLSSTAAAQSGSDSPPPPSSSGWATVPGERHFILRLTGGAGMRFGDPWSAGVISPPWVQVHGSFFFINAGPVRMGPSVGGLVGFNSGHSGVQGGPHVGWGMHIPLGPLLTIAARVDVPLLITRGSAAFDSMRRNPNDPCQPFAVAPPAMSTTGTPVDAPQTSRSCIGMAPGVEVGASLLLYLRSGFALVLPEINFGTYFGDSGLGYPVLGFGAGLLIDYEVLR